MKNFSSASVASSLQSVLLAGAKTGPDGLQVVPPDGTTGPGKYVVTLSDRLFQWLIDLRLLRHVPLAYLVPDPELLPPESIRFFHVDRTWTDRLIDGAMSAGNIGTVDMTFTVATLTATRKTLDDELGLSATTPMTGMIIRSELVERWPDLIVDAFPADKISVLRQDVVSESIMIVIFGGVPTEVHVREPHVGLRFGVEFNEQSKAYEFNAHDTKGKDLAQTRPIHLFERRVIDLADDPQKSLKAKLPDNGAAGDPTRSRDVAINLRQQPYAAVFKNDPAIPPGSQRPDASSKVTVRGKQYSVMSILGARNRRLLNGGK